ncbi:MAG: hypothetical protein GX672_04065 [Synergistaceae bacterium]|nr:hypothetical protein [Synergistaceae bacterium]
MSEVKYRIVKGRVSSIKEASLDDPIYNNNFVFGGTILRKSSKPDDEKTDLEGQKKEQENQVEAGADENVN